MEFKEDNNKIVELEYVIEIISLICAFILLYLNNHELINYFSIIIILYILDVEFSYFKRFLNIFK